MGIYNSENYFIRINETTKKNVNTVSALKTMERALYTFTT